MRRPTEVLYDSESVSIRASSARSAIRAEGEVPGAPGMKKTDLAAFDRMGIGEFAARKWWRLRFTPLQVAELLEHGITYEEAAGAIDRGSTHIEIVRCLRLQRKLGSSS